MTLIGVEIMYFILILRHVEFTLMTGSSTHMCLNYTHQYYFYWHIPIYI